VATIRFARLAEADLLDIGLFTTFTSGCFQKSKPWKTKPKIVTELSQDEKNHSHFETAHNDG
jgi:hypothetical protein